MTFQEDRVEDFLEVFNSSKDKIRHFPGCRHLTLMEDDDRSNVLITFSKWDDAQDLENYRHSELFKSTWAKTKPLFADRPQAFSMREKIKVED